MTPLTKNVLTVLGVLTIGYAGYFLYNQQTETVLGVDVENDAVYLNMLSNNEIFITRSQELGEIDLDISVLDDAHFRSLRRFTRDLKDQPTGRPNPFAEAETSNFISTGTE